MTQNDMSEPAPAFTMCDQCGTVSKKFLTEDCLFNACPSNRAPYQLARNARQHNMEERVTIPNSTILMFIMGWQGGTVHQVARALGVPASDIINADAERMDELMRMAQGIKQ